jgi:hypothetical protein
VIHADLRGYRLLSFARLLEISLERIQQLIRANNTFFWQSTPPLPAVGQKYTSLTTPLKRAPEVSRRLTTGHSAIRIFGGGLRVAPLQPETPVG